MTKPAVAAESLVALGAGESVGVAAKALADADAVMVVEGGKPVGVITRHDLLGFLSEGPRRFSELEHSCSGISPRTLSDRLRTLEHDGILVRRSFAAPPRVEYELTAKGAALLPIIAQMRRFGRDWLLQCEPSVANAR
mgnify:CR=1 FL=1